MNLQDIYNRAFGIGYRGGATLSDIRAFMINTYSMPGYSDMAAIGNYVNGLTSGGGGGWVGK